MVLAQRKPIFSLIFIKEKRLDLQDSGTCVEVGFALALDKPVIGYLAEAENTIERVARIEGGGLENRDGRPVDRQGLHVEDFGLPLNLMLAVPARIVVGGLAEALAQLWKEQRG